jgi:ankyrin repeat protein
MLSVVGSQLLLSACNQGDVEQCQSLIVEAKANTQFRNAIGETCLHVAAERGRVAVTELLLGFGADPNVTRHHAYGGQTPLHVAVRHQHIKIAEALLDKNADPNIQDSHGKTALHEAVATGNGLLVELLLRCGASPHCRDKLRKSPREYAIDRHLTAIEALLTPQHGEEGPPPVPSFAERLDAENRRIVWRTTKGPEAKK